MEEKGFFASLLSVLGIILVALFAGVFACLGWMGVQHVLGKRKPLGNKTVESIIVKMGEIVGVCDEQGKPYEKEEEPKKQE